jgi:uncharacterized membrane protein YcjF (UPF0283 family)
MKPKHDALARAFKFRQSDLEANRSGSMSDRQKHTLEKRFSRGTQLYQMIILHSVILLMGLLFVAWTQRGNPDYLSEAGLAFWLTLLITAGTIAVFTTLTVQHRRTLNQETQTGDVRQLSGDIELQPGTAQSRRLHIGGQIFKLDRQQAAAFQAGQAYHLYISPRTRQILSAEKATS